MRARISVFAASVSANAPEYRNVSREPSDNATLRRNKILQISRICVLDALSLRSGTAVRAELLCVRKSDLWEVRATRSQSPRSHRRLSALSREFLPFICADARSSVTEPKLFTPLTEGTIVLLLYQLAVTKMS